MSEQLVEKNKKFLGIGEIVDEKKSVINGDLGHYQSFTPEEIKNNIFNFIIKGKDLVKPCYIPKNIIDLMTKDELLKILIKNMNIKIKDNNFHVRGAINDMNTFKEDLQNNLGSRLYIFTLIYCHEKYVISRNFIESHPSLIKYAKRDVINTEFCISLLLKNGTKNKNLFYLFPEDIQEDIMKNHIESYDIETAEKIKDLKQKIKELGEQDEILDISHIKNKNCRKEIKNLLESLARE